MPLLPRKLRLQYPGAMYHAMSRGDRREKVFLDDVDRHDLIKTLAEVWSYLWSTYSAYLAAAEHRPGRTRVDRSLGEHVIHQDSVVGRQRFEELMERRRAAEIDTEALRACFRIRRKGLRRGILAVAEAGGALRVPTCRDKERANEGHDQKSHRKPRPTLKQALKALAARLVPGQRKFPAPDVVADGGQIG